MNKWHKQCTCPPWVTMFPDPLQVQVRVACPKCWSLVLRVAKPSSSPAGNTPFAILDYVGPPFCNTSDSNISQWICMSTQCRSQSVKPRYLNISLFLRCPDCFGRSLGYTGFFVQQQLLTSTPEDLKDSYHVAAGTRPQWFQRPTTKWISGS